MIRIASTCCASFLVFLLAACSKAETPPAISTHSPVSAEKRASHEEPTTEASTTREYKKPPQIQAWSLLDEAERAKNQDSYRKIGTQLESVLNRYFEPIAAAGVWEKFLAIGEDKGFSMPIVLEAEKEGKDTAPSETPDKRSGVLFERQATTAETDGTIWRANPEDSDSQ